MALNRPGELIFQPWRMQRSQWFLEHEKDSLFKQDLTDTLLPSSSHKTELPFLIQENTYYQSLTAPHHLAFDATCLST
jgi:hypothetical protein